MSGPAVRQPLVLVGLGPIGSRVVGDLDDTATALAAPARSPHAAIPHLLDRPQRLRQRFVEVTNALLEAGAGQGGQARLDVAVVADGPELTAASLTDALTAVTDALADDFPVLFPPETPPHQRSVWLTVHLGTPALVATADGRAFAELLTALEAFPTKARHPALSRVLLHPRQTTAGRLDDEGLEEALRAGVQALFLSGARDDDRIRSALGHRADANRLGTVAMATAELPLARVRRYARWRLAWSGLQTLLSQAEQPTTDPTRAEALRQRLDGASLLADFKDGDAAQRVRARAARLSGAEDHLPERWTVHLTDGVPDLRAKYRVLFEPITKPWTRRTDPTSDPDHEAMLRLVDAAEADVLAEVDRRLVALLDEELEPASALRVLPPLEHALKQAQHGLDEELAVIPEPLPSPEPPPPPDDPGLEALERVIDGRPGMNRTWTVLLALITVPGAAVMLGVSWLMAPDVPVAAVSSAALPPTSNEAWAVGLLAGVLVAVIWQVAVLWIWRDGARRALERRTHELSTAWRAGGAGQERDQAERLLAVRRRRTAHDLRRRYDAALERLGALRAAIRQAATEAGATLTDLRVRVGPTPRQDDLTGLLGSRTALHRPLVDPTALAERLESAGGKRDPARWAGEILAATWPRVGGLAEDLPCLDTDALLGACDRELGPLTISGLLGDAAGVGERARAFLADAGGALGWGVDPRDPHGDPVRGHGRDRRLLVAPTSLRGAVEAGVADSPVQLDPCWVDAEVPWISVLAVWDGFTTADVLRGMGVKEAAP